MGVYGLDPFDVAWGPVRNSCRHVKEPVVYTKQKGFGAAEKQLASVKGACSIDLFSYKSTHLFSNFTFLFLSQVFSRAFMPHRTATLEDIFSYNMKYTSSKSLLKIQCFLRVKPTFRQNVTRTLYEYRTHFFSI